MSGNRILFAVSALGVHSGDASSAERFNIPRSSSSLVPALPPRSRRVAVLAQTREVDHLDHRDRRQLRQHAPSRRRYTYGLADRHQGESQLPCLPMSPVSLAGLIAACGEVVATDPSDPDRLWRPSPPHKRRRDSLPPIGKPYNVAASAYRKPPAVRKSADGANIFPAIGQVQRTTTPTAHPWHRSSPLATVHRAVAPVPLWHRPTCKRLAAVSVNRHRVCTPQPDDQSQPTRDLTRRLASEHIRLTNPALRKM